MAKRTVHANIKTVAFPFGEEFVPDNSQPVVEERASSEGQILPSDLSNVLPTPYGFISFFEREGISDIPVLPNDAEYIFTYNTKIGNNVLVVLSNSGYQFFDSTGTSIGVVVNPPSTDVLLGLSSNLMDTLATGVAGEELAILASAPTNPSGLTVTDNFAGNTTKHTASISVLLTAGVSVSSIAAITSNTTNPIDAALASGFTLRTYALTHRQLLAKGNDTNLTPASVATTPASVAFTEGTGYAFTPLQDAMFLRTQASNEIARTGASQLNITQAQLDTTVTVPNVFGSDEYVVLVVTAATSGSRKMYFTIDGVPIRIYGSGRHLTDDNYETSASVMSGMTGLNFMIPKGATIGIHSVTGDTAAIGTFSLDLYAASNLATVAPDPIYTSTLAGGVVTLVPNLQTIFVGSEYRVLIRGFRGKYIAQSGDSADVVISAAVASLNTAMGSAASAVFTGASGTTAVIPEVLATINTSGYTGQVNYVQPTGSTGGWDRLPAGSGAVQQLQTAGLSTFTGSITDTNSDALTQSSGIVAGNVTKLATSAIVDGVTNSFSISIAQSLVAGSLATYSYSASNDYVDPADIVIGRNIIRTDLTKVNIARTFNVVPDTKELLNPWSFAILANKLYIYRKGLGSFLSINTNGTAWDVIAPSFLNIAQIAGIFSARSRLGAWDDTNSVYTSAILDPADFTPSLATQANVSKIDALTGRIINILPITDGFILYTTNSIILAQFNASLKTSIFKYTPLSTAIGIATRHEAIAAGSGKHFAFTSEGLVAVTTRGITIVSQDATDYARSSSEAVRLDYISNRYLTMSIAPFSRLSTLDYSKVTVAGRAAQLMNDYLTSSGSGVSSQPDFVPVSIGATGNDIIDFTLYYYMYTYQDPQDSTKTLITPPKFAFFSAYEGNPNLDLSIVNGTVGVFGIVGANPSGTDIITAPTLQLSTGSFTRLSTTVKLYKKDLLRMMEMQALLIGDYVDAVLCLAQDTTNIQNLNRLGTPLISALPSNQDVLPAFNAAYGQLPTLWNISPGIPASYASSGTLTAISFTNSSPATVSITDQVDLIDNRVELDGSADIVISGSGIVTTSFHLPQLKGTVVFTGSDANVPPIAPPDFAFDSGSLRSVNTIAGGFTNTLTNVSIGLTGETVPAISPSAGSNLTSVPPGIPALAGYFQPAIPSVSYLATQGSFEPLAPIFTRGIVLDLNLKNWGSVNGSYKMLVDYAPINETSTNPLTQIASAKFTLDNQFSVFVVQNTDGSLNLATDNITSATVSNITFGKFAFTRSGTTRMLEALVNLTTLTGADLEVLNHEGTVIATISQGIDTELLVKNVHVSKWFAIRVSKQYHLKGISFSGEIGGKR